MKRFAIGHILIKTNDLAQSVKNFEDLGFTATYRTDPAKAHNALIYLQDGSFLELFNPKPFNLPDKLLLAAARLLAPLQPSMMNRLHAYISGPEGLIDYALDSIPPERANAHMAAMRLEGADLGKSVKLSKTLRDGRKQTWSIAAPGNPRLPFLMSAYDPAVPPAIHETTHRNGALGISRLVIDVPDLHRYLSWYRHVILEADMTHQGNRCMLACGNGHIIELRQASSYRITEISLAAAQTLNGGSLLDPQRTNGASIRLLQAAGSSLE